MNTTKLYYAVNQSQATLQKNSLILADLQRNRRIVASGCSPLYEELDFCAHAPLDPPAPTLESKETPRFACKLPFGSTNVPSQEEEHSSRNLLNGQVLDISERFGAGIGHVEVLVVSGFVPTGHRNTLLPEAYARTSSDTLRRDWDARFPAAS